ncbi:MAG TPA: LLM class flavin-dependent oxidoreductase [Glaciihabitans sp.]|nr:LLM class flavin-dependent oxidoreductase [Glaciihabitans sp.]
MPDYGHPLAFGTFITPSNSAAHGPVQLAQLSEQLGFDLATFQDHTYQPGFHDTWTLMTWVAAKTERIHIAPNVLNVPLRLPAVTARSAASLDLLSEGRFDLGLGAGGFWDAIEAMGGRRLTPGQAVDALEEAISIMRGIWDAATRSPLRLVGHYYTVDGTKRGPQPAHKIPIWIGAYKPRMLRLVGRTADGWLPSLGYMQPGDFAAGNKRIDEAAEEAGRHPSEIRRLLNISGRFTAGRGEFLVGPSAQWVEELLPLVLADGAGTFILAGDDASSMERFAHEVVPALREAVAAERRTAGVPEGETRSAIALAARREGITYDAVPAELRDRVVEPGDFAYAGVKSTYMRGGEPGLVIQPRTTAEVVAALAFARTQAVSLGVRSGGHGISGRSTNDGGIIIDVGAFNSIEVLDESTRLVRIGAGARWMDVAAALDPYGWALSSGDYGGVGVGGLATAGGIGWLARSHGLTIDHLRAVEMVLADGSAIRASDTENAELFWGIRGAGANFGIALSFEFHAHEVGALGWAQLALDASDTSTFLHRWGSTIENSPRDLTSFLIMGGPRPGHPQVAQVMAVVNSDDPEIIIARLQPVADISPLLGQEVQLKTYAQIMANASPGPHQGHGEPVSRSGLLTHLTPEFADAAAKLLATGEVHFFQIRSMGGAVADVSARDTAFAHRSANFSVVAFGSDRKRLDAAWDELHSHVFGLYLSFETDRRPERLGEAFPSETLAQLGDLKRKYDPHNVFRDNFNVAPSPAMG